MSAASGKYAVGEYERRFLLGEVPSTATNPRRIVDDYLIGTRLRVRAVTGQDGTVARKLGHKRRVDAADPRAILHTSMYLDDAEARVLSDVPSRRLTKTRWDVDVDGTAGSINEFGGELSGLILLEIDFGSPESLERFRPPPWVGPEVTMDEAFTGGVLAGTTMADLADALRRVGFRTPGPEE